MVIKVLTEMESTTTDTHYDPLSEINKSDKKNAHKVLL